MSLAEDTNTECIEKYFSELNNIIEVQELCQVKFIIIKLWLLSYIYVVNEDMFLNYEGNC